MPRISLTEYELHIIAHLTRHFGDYMFHDDRPDHGMGILKGYREQNKDPRPQHVQALLSAMGKLNRASNRVQAKRYKQQNKEL